MCVLPGLKQPPPPTHTPQLKSLVNMMRVTGRFESEQQKLAPWGYGDDFDVAQVPPGLRAVLEKIQGSEAFCLGKPRDITINHRTDFFYRLDPHVDPLKDGGNVFILGLLSGTVLTLTPASKTMAAAQFTHMDQRRVSEQSWQVRSVVFRVRARKRGLRPPTQRLIVNQPVFIPHSILAAGQGRGRRSPRARPPASLGPRAPRVGPRHPPRRDQAPGGLVRGAHLMPSHTLTD